MTSITQSVAVCSPTYRIIAPCPSKNGPTTPSSPAVTTPPSASTSRKSSTSSRPTTVTLPKGNKTSPQRTSSKRVRDTENQDDLPTQSSVVVSISEGLNRVNKRARGNTGTSDRVLRSAKTEGTKTRDRTTMAKPAPRPRKSAARRIPTAGPSLESIHPPESPGLDSVTAARGYRALSPPMHSSLDILVAASRLMDHKAFMTNDVAILGNWAINPSKPARYPILQGPGCPGLSALHLLAAVADYSPLHLLKGAQSLQSPI